VKSQHCTFFFNPPRFAFKTPHYSLPLARTAPVIIITDPHAHAHPMAIAGGSVIFTHAGDDCTDIFAAFHPASALKDLETFKIGELDESIIPSSLYANKLKPEAQKVFEKGYRKLRAELIAAGMFNSNPLYYVYKVLSNCAMLALAIACAVRSDNFFVNMAGALVMGLFWQQCGWLAHDFLHHQVFLFCSPALRNSCARVSQRVQNEQCPALIHERCVIFSVALQSIWKRPVIESRLFEKALRFLNALQSRLNRLRSP
jgi:hypothetical protein